MPKNLLILQKMSEIIVDVQYACNFPNLPDENTLLHWVKAALQSHRENAELTIRIVDEKEGKKLNEKWRHGVGATNVLSFPFECPPEIKLSLLGDIVICAPLVASEAKAQNITIDAHWAHLVIHGVLHLLGYDHEKDAEAEKMENLERHLLIEKLNF